MRFCNAIYLALTLSIHASEHSAHSDCRVAPLQLLVQQSIENMLQSRIDQKRLPVVQPRVEQLSVSQELLAIQRDAIDVVNAYIPRLGNWLHEATGENSHDPLLIFVEAAATRALSHCLHAHPWLARSCVNVVSRIAQVHDQLEMQDCLDSIKLLSPVFKTHILNVLQTTCGFDDESEIEQLEHLMYRVAFSRNRYVLITRYPSREDQILIHHEGNPSDIQIAGDEKEIISHVCMPQEDVLMYLSNGKLLCVDLACSSTITRVPTFHECRIIINTYQRDCLVGLVSGEICCVDPKTKVIRFSYRYHEHPIVALTADYATYISIDSRGVVHFVDAVSQELRYTLVGPPGPVRFLGCVGQDIVVLISGEKDARVFDCNKGSSYGVDLIEPEHACITHAQVHQGLLWYAHSADDAIICFDLLGLKMVHRVRCYTIGASFGLRDDTLICMGGKGGTRLRAHSWFTILMKSLIKHVKSESKSDAVAALIAHYHTHESEFKALTALLELKKKSLMFERSHRE